MKVIRRRTALKEHLRSLKKKGLTVGFVPTMGYLHEGHLSLVRRSRKENDLTVVSIFVNPLQFGPKEDLSRYPRDEKRDLLLLKKEKADIAYLPDEKSFYSGDFETRVSVTELSRPLCGASRPIHFTGVATVVLKLLNQVSPDVMYLGQKDYQQFRVVEKMMKDLDLAAEVRLCPTVREKDGLAMSSRNVRLDAEERAQAAQLNKALSEAETMVRRGARRAEPLKAAMRKALAAATRARVDYAEIVDAATLKPVIQLKPGQKIELALAVFFSKTRLIDNRLIRV